MNLFENMKELYENNENTRVTELKEKLNNTESEIEKELLSWELNGVLMTESVKKDSRKKSMKDLDIIQEMKQSGASYDDIARLTNKNLLARQRSQIINGDIQDAIKNGHSIESAIISTLKIHNIDLDMRVIEKSLEAREEGIKKQWMAVVRGKK